MSLEQRVERLERQNRQLKVILMLALGALVVAMFVERAQPLQAKRAENVVRAEKFELVDGDGKVQAILEATKDGAYFVLRDGKGAWFYRASGYKDGGGTFYLQRHGGAFLNATANEIGVDLALYTNRPRIGMSVKAGDEKKEATLRAEKFELAGDGEKVLGALQREGYGSALLLMDSHAREQARLFSADSPGEDKEDGYGGLHLKYKGNTRALLSTSPRKGQIQLEDAAGKVLFKEPK